MPRLDRLWYEIDAQTQGFDKGILQSENRLKSFTEYAATHPVAVLGALSVAATLAGVKLASMAADFENEMAKINTVLDPTQASLKSLSDGIKETFTSMPVGDIKELTKGLYDVVSSGIDAGESLEFLNVAARSAVGGATTVAIAVDGLTTAVNAFKSQNLTVAQASDIMFQTVNKGKITFDELSSAMGQGAAIAASVNESFAGLNAVVAQLSLGGMNAAMGMIGYRSAVVNIIKPNEKFIAQFPELAMEFNKAKLEAVGFIPFLTQLKEAAKGNSEVFTRLFVDIQGYNAVQALMSDGLVGANNMLNATKNAAGENDKAFEKMGATTAATNAILKNQFHVEMVALGESVLPAYNAALESAVFLMGQLGVSASKVRMREIVNDLANLSLNLPKEKIFGIFDTTNTVKQHNDLVEFIESVREGRLELRSLSDNELKNVAAGMQNLYNSLPTEIEGFGEVMKSINSTLADSKTKTDAAAEATKKQTAAQTAGAIAFTKSRADDIAALSRNVTALGQAENAQKTYALSMQKLAAASRESRQAVKDAADAQATGNVEKALAAQEAAGNALGKATEARTEAREALKLMGEAERARQNEARALEQRRLQEAKSRRDLSFELEEALNRTTATAVDDMTTQLARAVAEFRAKLATAAPGMSATEIAVRTGQINALEAANGKTLELLKGSEAVNAQLREVDKIMLSLTDAGTRDTAFSRMGEQIDAIRASLVGVDEKSEEFKQKQQQILSLEQARGKLMQWFLGLADKGASAAEREEAAKRRQMQHVERTARDVQTLAASAFDAAQSFGIMNKDTADALNNVIGIASNLPAAMQGDVSSIAAIIGNVTKLAASIFGGDPEAKKIRQQNTDALERLTVKIGDLSKSSVTGTEIGNVRGAAQKLMDDPRLRSPTGFSKAYDTFIADLKKIGMSWEDLQQWAKQFGVTLKSYADIPALLDAIKIADLAAYTGTFAGQMQRLHDEFEVFNVTDPTEKLRRTIAFLSSKNGIPGISKALSGIDVGTAGGAQDAIARLQDLFKRLADGTITAQELGGASVDETRQAILDLIAQLRGGAGQGESRSFGYNATITEATGSHIAGLLSAGNVYAQRTMQAVETMAAAVLRAGPINPPIWTGSGSAASVIQITLTVNVNGTLSDEQARQTGETVGREAIDQINQGLAGRLRELRRAAGNAIIS